MVVAVAYGDEMDLVAWAAREAQQRLAAVDTRWLHVRSVAQRAEAVVRVVPAVDRPLLAAAAYLHDVGYAPELVATGFHPLDGATWLRGEGLEDLARLVAHHTGALEEARLLGFAGQLAVFEPRPSPTADALTYCDLTTGPSGELTTVAERRREIERRYGPDSLVARALRASAPVVDAQISRTEARLAALADSGSCPRRGRSGPLKTSRQRPSRR